MFSMSVRIGGPLELRDVLVAHLVQCIVDMDTAILRADPSIRCPYASGVTYRTSECTEDVCVDLEWESPQALIARGYGDCKSLVAWRIAWLRVRRGIETEPLIDRTVIRNGSALDVSYHVRLRGRYGGRVIIEDPSEYILRRDERRAA